MNDAGVCLTTAYKMRQFAKTTAVDVIGSEGGSRCRKASVGYGRPSQASIPQLMGTRLALYTSKSSSVIMMKLHAVAACLVLLAFGSVFAQQTGSSASTNAQGGAAKPQAAGTPGQFNLAAFTNITSCLPFNILIKPSASGSSSTGYALTKSVAPEVNAALNVSVADGTLYLGFNRKFESTVPIRVTVTMPAGKLEVVENQGMGAIIINPGRQLDGHLAWAVGAGRLGGGQVRAQVRGQGSCLVVWLASGLFTLL